MRSERQRIGGRRRKAAALGAALLIALAASVVLVRRSAGPGDGTWADAVASGDHELARALAAAGVDPETPRAHGLSPLMRACIRDDLEMVAILLGAGADIAATDPEGLTAAHAAASTDAAGCVGALADAGADLDRQSRNGMAPLHHAAATDSVDVIGTLAGLGVDLEARSDVTSQGHGSPRDVGATALGIAARAGQTAAVTKLLDLGAGVDTPSAAGHTPLLLAVFAGRAPDVVSALLAAGADPTIVASCVRGCSADGGNALEWAEALGREELVPLLVAAMAER